MQKFSIVIYFWIQNSLSEIEIVRNLLQVMFSFKLTTFNYILISVLVI